MNRLFIDEMMGSYNKFWIIEVAIHVGQTTGMCPNR